MWEWHTFVVVKKLFCEDGNVKRTNLVPWTVGPVTTTTTLHHCTHIHTPAAEKIDLFGAVTSLGIFAQGHVRLTQD